MILKLSQIEPLLEGLKALDGIKSEKGLEPFEFTAKVTWNKTKNIGILTRRQKDLVAGRNDLVRQMCPVGESAVPQERMLEFVEKMDGLTNTDEEVHGLLKFKPEDFDIYDKKDNPKGNKIPSTVLAHLLPLIEMPEDD